MHLRLAFRLPVQSRYHLFFQYNPFGPIWGNMSWYHVSSTDLVTWEPLPVALWPNSSYDQLGVFSGSTTIVNDVPTIAYTCVDPVRGQQQCFAMPANTSDPFLVDWIKNSANPVIPRE